jgi:hypothetical protein
MFELNEGFDRSSSCVAVSEVRPFGVVVDHPLIEIGLQHLDAVVQCLAQFGSDELVQDGSVKVIG